MAKLITFGPAITRGEHKTFAYLEAALPPEWTVIANYQLPIPSGGSIEIDAVVIGDRAVWVVDEKGFGGRILGDEHRWQLSDGSVRERPLDRILQVARMVKGRLAQGDPRLRDVWVQGLIILSADDADPREIRDERITRHVRGLDGSEQYFLNASLGRSGHLSSVEKDSAFRILCGRSSTRKGTPLQTIGDFELLESVQTEGGAPSVVIYRAKHRVTGAQAELRLIDSSAVLRAERETMQKWLQREIATLQKLRHVTGVVRLIENLKDVPNFDGDLQYFATDLPEGPALGERIADLNWPLSSRIKAARNLTGIVAQVHREGVFHRNITPSNIYFFGSETDFLISGFRLARLVDSPTTTVPIASDHPDAGPYTAPEIVSAIHDAGKAADVYALGVILFELLSGGRAIENVRTSPDQKFAPFSLISTEQAADAELLRSLEAIISWMTTFDARERLQNVDEVVDLLDQFVLQPTGEPNEQGAQHPLPVNSKLDNFRIVKALPSGGCFYVYLVADEANDAQLYVAKVVRYPELLQHARREFLALCQLDHQGIVRAIEVRDRTDAPYHLLEHFVAGETLHDKLNAASLDPGRVAKWASQILNALSFMESRQPRIYHGDLSPRNIVISNDDVTGEYPVLVDFGLAWIEDIDRSDAGIVGTAPYRPPERDVPGTAWPQSGDIYALGVILSQALFGELPYETDGAEYRKDSLRVALFDSGVCSNELAAIIRRAVAFRAEERFQSARDMLGELLKCPELGGSTAPPALERGVNTWLSELIKLFSQGRGNSENRGLDSQFAALTYVPTELDEELLPSILDHKYRLVILTGNPGDGKTAFLQQIARRLGLEGALPLHYWELSDETGWRFEAVLDGSASDTSRSLNSSRAVLDALLHPIVNFDASVDSRRTQLLAINDGRLLDYLYDRNSEGGPSIFNDLARALEDGSEELPSDIRLVNLNARSLVYSDGDIFQKVLDALVGANIDAGDVWESCSTCRAAPWCHVRFNVQTLRDSQLGPEVSKRLRALLVLVHGRGRLHLTMRELRSTLAFVFFGDQTCEEIHDALERTPETLETEARQSSGTMLYPLTSPRLAKLYFARAFSSGSRSGRLSAELAHFDPGKSDEPRVDRVIKGKARLRRGLEDLMLTPAMRQSHVDLELFGSAFGERDESLGVKAGLEHSLEESASSRSGEYALVRQRLFFESNSEINRSAGDDAAWLRLTPYRHAHEWFKALELGHGGEPLPATLALQICKGISMSDSAGADIADRYLAVRTVRSTKSDLLVLRLYDLASFQLRWIYPSGSETVRESLPWVLALEHTAMGDLALDITSDLFEVLMRLADGYHVGTGELDAVAAHLQTFKNQLLAQSTESVRLVHPTLGNFDARISVDAGVRRILVEAIT